MLSCDSGDDVCDVGHFLCDLHEKTVAENLHKATFKKHVLKCTKSCKKNYARSLISTNASCVAMGAIGDLAKNALCKNGRMPWRGGWHSSRYSLETEFSLYIIAL